MLSQVQELKSRLRVEAGFFAALVVIFLFSQTTLPLSMKAALWRLTMTSLLPPVSTIINSSVAQSTDTETL
jgi:hypothetical protein